MGRDELDDRVGFVDFVHHDDAREAKNAKGHLVMNDKRLKIDIWHGIKSHGGRGRDSPDYDRPRGRSPPSYGGRGRGGFRGRGRGRGGGGYGDREDRYDHGAPRGAKPEFEFPRDEAGRKRTHLQEEKFFPGGRAHRPGDDLPPEDDPGSTRSLFLGNLDRSLTREEIYSEFEEYGDILECDIKQARNANHS